MLTKKQRACMEACIPWMSKKSGKAPHPSQVKKWLARRFDKKCREYAKKNK